MPCAVALSNSPVFSPSHRVSPVFRTPPAVTLSMHSSIPSTPYSSSSLTSPLSPLGLRLSCINDAQLLKSTSKRKRPLRIEIPVAPVSLAPVEGRTVIEERVEEVEVEGEGYEVYCKRGKRGRMEDRYSAVVGLEGDHKQVCYYLFYFIFYF